MLGTKVAQSICLWIECHIRSPETRSLCICGVGHVHPMNDTQQQKHQEREEFRP